MASGLLKYVGRSNEQPPPTEESLNQRIKARMERMGMVVESEGSKSPRVPAKGHLAQTPSHRQLIGNQARVTPRSLELSQDTGVAAAVPNSGWQASNSVRSQPQLMDSRSATPNDVIHGDYEDGMFDTDAENLDSTTNLSDMGDQLISRTWPQHNDHLADKLGYAYQDGSEYDNRIPHAGRTDFSTRHIGTSENLTNHNIDVESLSSEEYGEVYQDVNECESNYGSEATRDLSKDQESTAEYSCIVNPATPRQEAIDSIMDSPSIQQSLVHRTSAGHSKAKSFNPRTIEAARFSIKEPQSSLADRATIYKLDKQKPFGRTGVQQQEPLSLQSAMHRTRTPELGGHSTSHTEHVPKAEENPTQKQQISQSYSHVEVKSLHSVSVDQQLFMQGAERQTPKAADQSLACKTALAPDPLMGNIVVRTQAQQTITPYRDQTISQDDVVNALPVQAVATEPAAPNRQDSQDQDVEQPKNISALDAPAEEGNTTNAEKRMEFRKRALELDYSAAELSRMPYKLLTSESFDHVPRQSIAVLPSELAEGTLAERLRYAYNLKDDGADDNHMQRQVVFSNLTIEQYEDIGELLLEKFASVILQYKEARRAKRSAAKEVEKEVGRREELVRAKTTAVEGDLAGLKSAGRKVVQGNYA